MSRRRCAGDPALDQWFTPFWAAEELIQDALKPLGRVPLCEPSCGTGAFLAAFPEDAIGFGVEIDPRLAKISAARTGREVVCGDFLTIDLGGREIGAVIGNPPFAMGLVEGFVDRSHELLPEGGMLAMILPAFAFQTPRRVARWMEQFSIDVSMIPRTLFPSSRQAIVWAKFRKAAAHQSYFGLMLFREQRDVEQMPRYIRDALEGSGTWREAVRRALEALGGAASLQAIYDMITPERRTSKHWQPKVRQILQRHHKAIERGRWAI